MDRIQLTYEDSTGKRVKSSRDSISAVQKILADQPSSKTEPVVVVWENSRVPAGEVELEEGGLWNRRDPLPFGYHTLNGETLLIHAPRKAYAPPERTWGLFLPLYAVPPNGGDLGDLQAYMNWVRELGGNVVATLPLLAAFDDEPSPYSPVSRLFWNERYLDIEALPEFQTAAAEPPLSLEAAKAADVNDALAVKGQRAAADAAAVQSLRSRRAVLEKCAERFVPDEGFEEFAAYAREYAEFRAAEKWRGSLDSARDEAAVRFHLYVQYRMSQQMQQLSEKGLYLDFPLGVNAGGYDVARYGHVFAKGVSVGAPPDAFFTKGQNWGFPPFHPEALRADRYRYFRAAIAHHARHAGILRLDHVMGLHRLYWIPDGMDAKDGVYVRYHDDELYAIVVLESVRNRCAIVGEDLGTVPDYVPKAMRRHGLRSMYVVQYEAKPKRRPLATPPTTSVASVNTHDMPTFAAFWSGKDIDDRVDQDLLDDKGARKERDTRAKIRKKIQKQLGEGDALRNILMYLAKSDAEVVLINLEDLWGEIEPQNVPGVPERSWKQVFKMSLQEAREDAHIVRILTALAEARALLSSGRGQ